MQYKGTKSEQNIKAAFIGESEARNRYTYFAQQARVEGNEEIAALFEKMAENEKEHAKLWFKLLNEGLGTTGKNLETAAAGENHEWKSMYPGFAQDAREEGFELLATMFERVAAIENDHEKRFLETFLKFRTAEKARDGQLEGAEAAPVVAPKPKTGYRCMFCGFMAGERMDVCPVCEAIGAFEHV